MVSPLGSPGTHKLRGSLASLNRSYDSDTRSWYSQIPLDRPKWAAEMRSTLFEAARVHGTTIQARVQPAGESSPSRQVP